MFILATVAQLVEQLIRNQQVGGSSPPSSSKPPIGNADGGFSLPGGKTVRREKKLL